MQLPAGGAANLVVPLPRGNRESCIVDFEVSPTAVAGGRHQGLQNQDAARARRALLDVRVQAREVVRIAFDVSPLSHPRTGVGNYIRGSLAGLVEAAGRHEVVPFAPTSAPGRRTIREALAGLPVEPRLRFLPFAHFWRQGWSRVGWPPVERFLGPVDVLHFSDWMYPPQGGGLRSTMVHDLVPAAVPGVGPGAHAAHARREVPQCRPHLRRDLRQLGVHEGRRRLADRRARGEGRRRLPGRGRALPRRGRARRPRAPVRPDRGHARAAQEPRDAARRAACPRATRSPSSARRGGGRSRRSTGRT